MVDRVIIIVVVKMDAREVVIGLEVCANIFILVSHRCILIVMLLLFL